MPVPDEINQGSSAPLLLADTLSHTFSEDSFVSGISLNLQKGDILALLGLNGAGKTTTLRMLCGALVPDTGTVSINGHSLINDPLTARRQIGFLPDQPPLYDDMRVCEYLRFTGQIRGLSGKLLSTRQQSVTEQCMLEEVNRKLIGTLSKGFRQRVGLAQALIHQPAVVLLDEPSNGLDPQQLDGMRELIQNTAESAAIVLSTHLLAEAQATCNRFAIIHNGQLVADQLSDGTALESIFHGAIT